jgi:hypothetical protein
MGDWQEEYIVSIPYPHLYHPELNPLRAALALLNAGVAPPSHAVACELGFGQGLSVNLHAAASRTQWWGTDFMASQAAFARELAEASGADIRLFDQSFAEFCARPELPDFDFIGLHGVWSWASAESRRVIVEFIRRKLKVGGLVYLSYNVTPGTSDTLAIRDVLRRHTESMSASSLELAQRIEAAITFGERLLAASPLFQQSHPQAAAKLAAVRTGSPGYVAHEYLNRAYVSMAFSQVHEWLAPASLEYVCSANFFDRDEWNLTPQQQELLAEIPDVVLRETARDLMSNRSFRAEYWIKGLRRLTPGEREDALRRQRIMLVRARADVSCTAKGTLGEFSLPASACDPLLDTLADLRPRSLGQIEQAVRDRAIPLNQLLGVTLPLIENGSICVVQDEAVVRAARKQTEKLNALLCERARHRLEMSMLASPMIGAGIIEVGRLVQLFVLALQQGKKQPAELAAHVLPICMAAGIRIIEQGRTLDSSQEIQTKLTAYAAHFLEKQSPVLRALQIL